MVEARSVNVKKTTTKRDTHKNGHFSAYVIGSTHYSSILAKWAVVEWVKQRGPFFNGDTSRCNSLGVVYSVP